MAIAKSSGARKRAEAAGPAERGYWRFCPISLALDHVGDRWTLLIVHMLLSGPQRYTDLKLFVDGAGSNILADRLRRLAHDGIVERSAAGAPGSPVTYHLTDRGRALEPVIRSLFRWGLPILIAADPREPDSVFFDQTWAIGPKGPLKREIYQWTIDGFELELLIDGFELRRTRGKAKTKPAATFVTTAEVLTKLVSGEITASEATAKGLVKLGGSREAIGRMFLAAGFPEAS